MGGKPRTPFFLTVYRDPGMNDERNRTRHVSAEVDVYIGGELFNPQNIDIDGIDTADIETMVKTTDIAIAEHLNATAVYKQDAAISLLFNTVEDHTINMLSYTDEQLRSIYVMSYLRDLDILRGLRDEFN